LIIEYEGTAYEFDLDDMTVKQALKIEKHIDGTLIDFEKGMLTGSTPCIQALGWLVLFGGDSTPVADADFKYGKFMNAFAAAVAEKEAEAAKEKAKAEAEGPTAGALNGQTSGLVSSLSA
jgi:hypothetical protein